MTFSFQPRFFRASFLIAIVLSAPASAQNPCDPFFIEERSCLLPSNIDPAPTCTLPGAPFDCAVFISKQVFLEACRSSLRRCCDVNCEICRSRCARNEAACQRCCDTGWCDFRREQGCTADKTVEARCSKAAESFCSKCSAASDCS